MDIGIGKVTHFFNHISVAVVDLTGEIKLGDKICILGRITELEQRVTSLEINHHKITAAGAGTEVALKVIEPVREGDLVYKVVETEQKYVTEGE